MPAAQCRWSRAAKPSGSVPGAPARWGCGSTNALMIQRLFALGAARTSRSRVRAGQRCSCGRAPMPAPRAGYGRSGLYTSRPWSPAGWDRAVRGSGTGLLPRSWGPLALLRDTSRARGSKQSTEVRCRGTAGDLMRRNEDLEVCLVHTWQLSAWSGRTSTGS